MAILRHWAEHRSDSVAFRFTDVETHDTSLTYDELWEEVRALAGYLQGKCRIRPGDRVLLLYPPGLDFIVGFFACHA
ncbi:AMP-binding protein, partial [Stieleria sp.]|uniref:AMP-binding protein n=1 Tax=Stieleria sp. TaxID=2795976 RepID=UPI003565FDC3